MFVSWTGFSHRKFCAVALLFSIGLNIVWAHSGYFSGRRDSTWYWMPFRLHQFAVGALSAELRSSILMNTPSHSCAAAVCVLISVLLFCSNQAMYPYIYGWATSTACMVLIAFGDSPLTGKLLRSGLLRYVGQCSYSIYLVHWPLIVFFKHIFLRSLQKNDKLVLFVVSIVLGSTMYEQVEDRFRCRDRNAYSKLVVYLCMSLSGALAIMGCLLVLVERRGMTAVGSENSQTPKLVANCHVSKFRNGGCEMSRLARKC